MFIAAQTYCYNKPGNIKAWRKSLEENNVPERICDLIGDIRRKSNERTEFISYAYCEDDKGEGTIYLTYLLTGSDEIKLESIAIPDNDDDLNNIVERAFE